MPGIIFPLIVVAIGVFVGIHRILKKPINWDRLENIGRKTWRIFTTVCGVLFLPVLPAAAVILPYQTYIELKPLLYPHIAPLIAWAIPGPNWELGGDAWWIPFAIAWIIYELIRIRKRLDNQ